MTIAPNAGRLPDEHSLVNLPRLVSRYYSGRPDPADPAQQVAFGTSGHRGSSLKNSFNEWHILATTQAICDYRRQEGIDGPLFMGMDTHALSERPSSRRWKCWRPTASRRASTRAATRPAANPATRRPRRSPTPS